MKQGKFHAWTERMRFRFLKVWAYWNGGVWSDMRNVWWVNIVKTANLSYSSFTDKDLQTQACAMTYRTSLAIVPALALLFAIGRGFGFQKILEDELYAIFPAQSFAIEKVLSFVNSYLDQSSEGVFVGIGVLFLLWTLISLVNNVESTFNLVWGVKQGRSFWRKITDYLALFFILPVLMICASGISIFLSSALQTAFDFEFMTPVISILLEVASWIFTWLFFTMCYKLIPNTKVKWTNAIIAGVLAGTGFRVLQWLFVTGQIYVTKYNAIYGSFAFLPLLLLWLQLSWMVTLSGALICYSSQNIFLYAMSTQTGDISSLYRSKVIIAIMSILTRRFVKNEKPLTAFEITEATEIPPRLVTDALDSLVNAGLVARVVLDGKNETIGYQPAMEPSQITLGLIRRRLDTMGSHGFIPRFNSRFADVVKVVDKMRDAELDFGDKICITDINFSQAPCPTRKRGCKTDRH